MSLLFQISQPVVFAHRGASAAAPENTLAAFKRGVEMGAPAIELDVKLSADGHVVVIHDQRVDRTTNGRGDVGKLSLEEMQALDAGSHFSPQFAGEKIPTLAEVFEEVGTKIFINVELTNYASPGDGLSERVAELVRRHAMQERVMFSSFHPLNLIRMRRLLPSVPSGLLAQQGTHGRWARGFIGRLVTPGNIHPYFDDVDQAFVQSQKTTNHPARRIHVWTVNDPQDMRRLFDLGVDGIFTDYPDLALNILNP
jgi:glycerophosphoryl diester phosphodiesterase